MSERPSSEHFETGLGRIVERKQELEQDPVGFFLEQRQLEGTPEAGGGFDFLPPAHRAEMLWGVFQEVKSKAARTAKEKTSNEDDESIDLLLALYNDPETKALYLQEVGRHAEEKKLMNGSHEKYRALDRQIRTYEESYDRIAGRLFASRGERASERDKLTYQLIERRLGAGRKEMDAMLREFPRLAARASYDRIAEYGREFDREKFVWLPSRRVILEKIEGAMLSGRPVLMLGESGTGKTSLVRAAAKNLTGQEPLKAQGGPSTRLQDSLRKQAVGEGEKGGTKTYLEYGELAQAITGMERSDDAEPRHGGGIYFDDEFNIRSREVQMEIVKAVSGIQPGREARLPLVGKVKAQPRYGFIAAGNPSGERYERQPTDPAVRREFGEAITVDYPEQSEQNPELFEAMLASLMDKNGRLRFSAAELSPAWKYKVEGVKKIRELETDPQKGGSLWRFAEAMNELYKSFSHKETVLKDKGEAQYLSEFVLDPGVVFGWLRGAVEEGYTGSLEDYLNEKIEAKLSEAGIVQADLDLARDFFKHFGLLKKRKAGKAPAFSPLTPGEIGLLSPRVRYEERIAPKITEGSAVIGGKSVKYKTEGTVEAPVEAVRIEGAGAKAKRWRVLGHTDAGELVIHSDDARKEKYRLVSPEEFTGWEAGVNPEAMLAELDMGKLPSEVRNILEGREFKAEFRELASREREAIKKFFGKEMEVPPLPPEITPEKYKEWKEKGLELHYLPPVEMKEDSNFPGWKQRPGKKFTPGQQFGIDFFDAIKKGELPAEAVKLSGAWMLVDTRRKPQYSNGDQGYDNDVLEPVLAELRKKKLIADFKVKGSRFNISPEELEKPAVREALAKALGIPVEAFHLPRAIDNNYLGNAFYPEWGETTSIEWFEDVYQGRHRLYGGVSDYGGLSRVHWGGAGGRDDGLGFRPSGRFSQKR